MAKCRNNAAANGLFALVPSRAMLPGPVAKAIKVPELIAVPSDKVSIDDSFRNTSDRPRPTRMPGTGSARRIYWSCIGPYLRAHALVRRTDRILMAGSEALRQGQISRYRSRRRISVIFQFGTKIVEACQPSGIGTDAAAFH